MTGAGHQTRMSNHRFKPFLRPLKMKISTLTNLLYKMYVKQKTGRKHAHTRCTKNLCKYTLKKKYIYYVFICFTYQYTHFFFTLLSYPIYTHFFFTHCCLILHTRIFSFCWSPILPSRYFVSKKKMKNKKKKPLFFA